MTKQRPEGNHLPGVAVFQKGCTHLRQGDGRWATDRGHSEPPPPLSA
jgi:hypothetical protein